MPKALASVIGVVGWIGLVGAPGVADAAPRPSHGVNQITIDYKWTSFRSDHRHYVIEWKDGGYVVGGKAVDARRIDGLYVALKDLQPADAEQRCLSHTDDYPEFDIVIEGSPRVTLRSGSNCAYYAPWNVTVGGKPYVQYTGAAGRAVVALLAAVDSGRWKSTPAASMKFGMQLVDLGSWQPGGAPARDPERCAKDLEANPKARAMFGQVHVSSLRLRCDLEGGACKNVRGTATFEWKGVTSEIVLPCKNGVVQVSAGELAPLRDFLDSKPVRTLVTLSRDRPHLIPLRNGWQLGAADRDLPMLEFDAKQRVIAARSLGARGPSGQRFWNALGLDPKQLTSRRYGSYETAAKLDLAGKRVP